MIKVKDIGITPYDEALEVQHKVHAGVAEGDDDCIIYCQHPHVYTFGKSADHNNLLIQPEFLKSIGATVHQTERGGDITYHGPGQLVGYPILNLRAKGIGVKKYVETLEESLIATLATFGVEAYQIDGLTGIWVGGANEIKRKIGAIGIRIRNGVSLHGFALNIHTDLNYFNHIVPCGITDKAVTSLEKETGATDLNEFTTRFNEIFQQRWSALS